MSARTSWITGCLLAAILGCGGDKDDVVYVYPPATTPDNETGDTSGNSGPVDFIPAWIGGAYMTLAIDCDTENAVPAGTQKNELPRHSKPTPIATQSQTHGKDHTAPTRCSQ